MIGEVYFNMREQQHPISGSSKFLMKRWTKYTVYSKSGSYIHCNYVKSGSYGWNGTTNFSGSEYTNNPNKGTVFNQPSPINADLYQTCSIYLYDYVLVSDQFFYNNVYTTSFDDNTPSTEWNEIKQLWHHDAYTFRNSPNAITNNYIITYTKTNPYPQAPSEPITTYRDDGVYFEIVKGYPRNHFTHKRDIFSLYSFRTFGDTNNAIFSESYLRNRQTLNSTIGPDGLNDGSLPVQSIQVGNLNLVQTDNVINH